MTDLENNGQEMDLTELEVMEPKMMIHDDLNDTRMQVVITTSYNNSWIV